MLVTEKAKTLAEKGREMNRGPQRKREGSACSFLGFSPPSLLASASVFLFCSVGTADVR
jgi:hypothetical protein